MVQNKKSWTRNVAWRKSAEIIQKQTPITSSDSMFLICTFKLDIS